MVLTRFGCDLVWLQWEDCASQTRVAQASVMPCVAPNAGQWPGCSLTPAEILGKSPLILQPTHS